MTEAQQIAKAIQRSLPRVKIGTLRFWGHWFGRPYDSCHQVVSCSSADEVLRVMFNEDEVLSVWNPRDAIIDRQSFRIDGAARVRWQWFYYGRPKTAENLYFEDFTYAVGGIAAETNVDWYTPGFQLDPSQAAVEIL